MKLLFIGDVVGEVGCLFLQKQLPKIKRQYEIDVTVVNGENSANGNGITRHSANQIFHAGADVITTGNHAFQRKTDLKIFEDDCIIRPANYGEACIGKGYTVLDMGSCQIAVINVQGLLYMQTLENPFHTVDNILKEIETPCIFVDFHAEATSEKKGMGFYLAKRVTAVMGTHTHVQTADACILEGHTGYITDVGMTGPEDSVLGVEKSVVINKFRYHCPVQFRFSESPCFMNAAVVKFDEKTGRATAIERLIVR